MKTMVSSERFSWKRCLGIATAIIITSLLMGCPERDASDVASTSPGDVGTIWVPEEPAPYPLDVDGEVVTMNADLSTGAWEWYRFDAEAGRKYYIFASGNAPVNVTLFKGVETEEDGTKAVMLWTTDPAHPELYYWEYPGIHANEDGVDAGVVANKAIAIPSFVAEETGEYYIVIQAARILECLPDCRDDDVRLAAYYDVRTYNVQVGTVAEAADANELNIYDPAVDEAPFLKGEVKINKHDWFYFDATADSNYMIEFMEPAFSRGSVKALVYSPLGDVTCEVIDCDNCNPQPLYAPHEGRYFILVVLNAAPFESGHVDLTPDEEFFGFEYLLRVFRDDHGNLPALATRIDTPDLNEESEVAGYLTRGDEDWFDFVAPPHSTFWVETRGRYDLRLNVSGNVEQDPLDDEALGLASFLQRQYDGRNDMAIFQTHDREQILPFSVRMIHKPLNPFRLDMGGYSVAVIADDHVNAHIQNVRPATEIEIGEEASGILWPEDTDMFKFSARKQHFLYRVTMEGAHRLDLRTINAAQNGFDFHGEAEMPEGVWRATPLTVYFYNDDRHTRLFPVVSGAREDRLETRYTILAEENDHRSFTGNFDRDLAAAQEVSPEADGEGVLWPTDSDVFKVVVDEESAGKMIEVTLTPERHDNTVDLLWWAPGEGAVEQEHVFWTVVPEAGEYGIVVRHNDARPERTVDYTVSVRFEADHNFTGDFEDDMERATEIGVSATSEEKELWPGDSDVYSVSIAEEHLDHMLTVVLECEDNAPVELQWWESGHMPESFGREINVVPPEDGQYGIIVRRTDGASDRIVTYVLKTSIEALPEEDPEED